MSSLTFWAGLLPPLLPVTFAGGERERERVIVPEVGRAHSNALGLCARRNNIKSMQRLSDSKVGGNISQQVI
jgi:hypothetical protein